MPSKQEALHDKEGCWAPMHNIWILCQSFHSVKCSLNILECSSLAPGADVVVVSFSEKLKFSSLMHHPQRVGLILL